MDFVQAPAALALLIEEWRLRGRPEQPPSDWPRTRWIGMFPELGDYLSALPDRLERPFLRLVCEDASSSADAAKRAFVAVMAWGFGSVGYGPWRTRRMLDSTPDTAGQLASVAETLAGSGAVAAYDRLGRRDDCYLPGLGPAFGTKFLFFAQPDGQRPVSLILDSLISRWLDREAGVRLNPLSWSTRTYQRYVDGMQAWADSLGCDPGELEYVIFQAIATESGSQWSNAALTHPPDEAQPGGRNLSYSGSAVRSSPIDGTDSQPVGADTSDAEPGHLFLVRGDLLKLACDAWLLPTDTVGRVEDPWRKDPDVAAHVDGMRLRSLPAGWGKGLRTFELSGSRAGGPAAWATDVGGISETSIDWYLKGLDAFLNMSAARLARTNERKERSLLAVPLIGTGHGGQLGRKGGIMDAVVRRLIAFTARTGFDAVLVLRDARGMGAAQAIRWRAMRESGGPDPWDGLAPAMVELAGSLSEFGALGKLVVFFGAGAGAGAGLPTWQDLLSRLAKVAEIAPSESAMMRNLDARDQALIIENQLGRKRLRRILGKILSRSRYSLLQGLLGNLPANQFVTTNFDRLFELAWDAAGGDFSVLPYEPSAAKSGWLLKLHGSVDHDDVVLTRTDYMSYGERRAALAGIVQALLITRHMLFVGYSLSEEDFHQTVHDVRNAIGPTPLSGGRFGTAILAEPAGFLGTIWEDDLNVVSVASPDRPSTVQEGGRIVQILLDRVIAEAFRRSTDYVLDDSYSDLLSVEERALGQQLRALSAVATNGTSDTAAAVVNFLQSLGYADDPNSEPEETHGLET